jgi:chromosome segregation ATPase
VELSGVLERESLSLGRQIQHAEEELAKLEDELIPARSKVAGLAQAEVSEVDMALGQAGERHRQIERVIDALDLGRSLTEKIQVLQKEIEPLQSALTHYLRESTMRPQQPC